MIPGMSVTAKCHNYTGCLLAYRGEEIQLTNGAPMVCPECGKAVTAVQGGAAKLWRLIPWLVLLVALAAGVVFALPYLNKLKAPEATPTPAPAAPATPQPVVSPTPPRKKGTPPPTPHTTPVAPLPDVPILPPVAPKTIELNPERQETRQVRDEVLKRIDLIPGLTPANKDKLYNSVQRARSMGLVLTLPFSSGRTTMAPGEVQAMKAALEAGQVMKLRDDPTAVFVVLGYADSKGDNADNLKVSQKRADSVVNAMREKCGVGNVTHAVAMGGSTMHDAQSLDKNRIVEVWAVLP